MLVVRRRPGQSITIAGGIEIEILKSSPGYVKLGISAPPEVMVCRKEVELTREQNKLASQALSSSTLRGLQLLLTSSADEPEEVPADAKKISPER